MPNKRQTERDTKARGRALVKTQTTELLAPISEQRYEIAEAAERMKLRSHSTSPDLSASIKLARALLQHGLNTGASARQQAELLRACHNLCRTQIAIIGQLSLLLPDSSLKDYATVCVEVARSVFEQHAPGQLTAVDEMASDLADIVSRASLIKVETEETNEPVELTGGQSYSLPGIEQASATLSQSSELQLTRFYIQRLLDEEPISIGSVILLLRQECACAITQLQFGQKTGELVSRETRREITNQITNRVTATLERCPDFDIAIDQFREELQRRFAQPQIENQ